MAEVTSKDYKVVIIVIILIIIGGIVGYTFWKYGAMGWQVILSSSISIIFWLVMLALVGGVVYFIFFYEKKIDVSWEAFCQVKDECSTNYNEYLGNLWTKGDKDHRPRCYGKIIGWSHRQNYSIVKGKDPENPDKSHYENEDIFFVKMKRRKKIVVRVPESMHDELHGDIYINCCSFNKAGYYYYPDTKYLDFDALDKTIHNEGVRYLNLDIVSLLHPAIVKALGLTRREIESTEGQTGSQIVSDKKKELIGK